MDQSQPVPLFGERYELVSENEHGHVEVIDHQPWRQCWSCGSTENEPDELFCTHCGADLRNRRYRGMVTSTYASDTVPISAIAHDAVQSLLPVIFDQLDDQEQTLIILKQSDAIPATLPLGELSALRVGLSLGRMLDVLHQQHLELGAIAPSDLGLTAAERPQLLNIHNLRRMNDAECDDDIRSDLQALAGLLEALTSIPRMTQRLDDDALALSFDEHDDLSMVLRDIRTDIIQSAHQLVERLDMLLTHYTCPNPLRQVVGAATDTGMLRDHNEDSFLYLTLGLNNTSKDQIWGVYVVADGMGGHAAGEVASGLAIRRAAEVTMNEYLTYALNPDSSYDQEQAKNIVRLAINQANEAVRQEGMQHGNDMGTTITMALVIGDRAIIGNIGDSRTYLYRDNHLQRITKDHSLVMRLVELGQISENDIYTHPQRNAVLRSLGDRPNIDIDIFVERLAPGDALLLCSDGQWEMTRDHNMEHIIQKVEDPMRACAELITAANQAGGEDNITSILVHFR